MGLFDGRDKKYTCNLKLKTLRSLFIYLFIEWEGQEWGMDRVRKLKDEAEF